MKSLALLLVLLAGTPIASEAQLERRRAVPTGPVELTFMAPRSINVLTVEPMGVGDLHYSIMHTFGEVNSGARELWGIDNNANIRLSFEYGVSERLSLSFGRSSVDKVLDLGGRWHLIRQMADGSVPISVTLSGGLGWTTGDYSFLRSDYTGVDRLNYNAFLHLARQFSPELSLQVSPGVAVFQRNGPELRTVVADENYFYGVALSGRFRVRPRLAVTGQVLPRFFGEDSDVNFGAGIDIETGGHVFQLYLVTSNSLSDSYLLAGENGGVGDGEFRFGFNINRVFNVGGK